MLLNLSTEARTAMATGLNGVFGASAIIRIYDGSKPAAGAAITTETLLAEFDCDAAAFGSAVSGVLTIDMDPDLQTTAEAGIGTKTATWARILKSDGTTWVMDCDVSDTGGNGVLKLDNASITELGTVTLTTGTLTMPNA